MKHEYRQVGLMAVLALVTSISVCPWEQTLAAGNQTVSNTALPQNGTILAGTVTIPTNPTNNTLNINQTTQNAVIKWQGGFNIGANATVNFTSNQNNFNTLNYDSSGQMSQIYGKLNGQNGNIYVVNPSGVQIGNSAQINVGSLTVSNQTIKDENLTSFDEANKVITGNQNINNAELMSLGHISANTVTFIGERVVIDTERLAGTTDTGKINLNVVSHEDTIDPTVDKNKGAFDIVLGQSQGTTNDKLGTVTLTGVGIKDNQETNSDITEKRTSDYTYTWIKNGTDLQNIKNGLSGHYALRNGIDLTGEDFTPVGTEDNEFKGKLDGLGFSIFGLHMDTTNDTSTQDAGTGLFGYTNGAIMGYFNLISGTTDTDIKGGKYTGALIGHAVNTKVKGVKTTLDVTGTSNVGGLVGYAEDSTFMNVVNTGVIEGQNNVGGILGVMARGQLGIGETQDSVDGETHNLGKVAGVDASGKNDPTSYNIGGLVGSASAYDENNKAKQDDQQQPVLPKIGGIADFTIDTRTNKLPDVTNKAIYNSANVTGGYNVGGAIGSATGALVGNVTNNGAVTAMGYTTEEYYYHSTKANEPNLANGIAHQTVRVGNVGGILGSAYSTSVMSVTNTGDVVAAKRSDNATYKDFYGAGNVGGIVGRAEDSNIITAVNKENHVYGAHNVGGVAGYFGSNQALTENTQPDGNKTIGATRFEIYNSMNSGGEIVGTGAMNDNGIAQENIRDGENASTPFNIGNIGGITGVLYGDTVHVDLSGNRGTVHSVDMAANATETQDINKAANVGGVVGKIDTSIDFTDTTKDLNKKLAANIESEETYRDASVSNSYNTGDVRGFTGVGGVVGFTYNGAIAGSYNLGNVRTTRTKATDSNSTSALNMGGILGDSEERMGDQQPHAFLYDVYNQGTIGYQGNNYLYSGRHVGGIVGRLSGALEKASNTGAIYNGYTVTGGLVGYLYTGKVENSFNTGNVTGGHMDDNYSGSATGGLVGNASSHVTIRNAYNLGNVRGIDMDQSHNNDMSVGGILGSKDEVDEDSIIENVYTSGNLYASGGNVGAIIGFSNEGADKVTIKNTYYIEPENKKDNFFYTAYKNNTGFHIDNTKTKTITYENRNNLSEYSGLTFADNKNLRDDASPWRMYDGKTTPILNAFKPYALKPWEANPAADPNANKPEIKDVISGLEDTAYKDPNVIQFGTAYNPLLTIIHADNNVADTDKGITIKGFIIDPTGLTGLNEMQKISMWQTMGIRDSFAVYGDVKTTIDGFDYSKVNDFAPGYGSMAVLRNQVGDYNVLYSGTIYTDGDLTIKNYGTLGNASAIYGKTITIIGEQGSGDFSLNGTIRATNGSVTITNDGGSVSTYGSISSSQDGDKFVGEGLGDTNSEADLTYEENTVKDASKDVENVAKQYQFKDNTDTNDNRHGVITADKTGTVDISAAGDVNLLYGNNREGIITAEGGLTVASNAGNIFIDGDINAGKAKDNKANITLTGTKEMVLDISNIGKGGAGDVSEPSNKNLHDFLDNTIVNFDGNGASDGKIAMDMSDEAGTGFDFNKYDNTDDKLSSHLQAFNNRIQANGYADGKTKYTYTWLKNADQLNAIQNYSEKNTNSKILTYNFALKNDIDASTISKYKTIGTYSGTLDGRTYRISGLNADEGIFGTLDTEGVVKNLKVYSSKIDGDTAGNGGVIAKTNNGTLDNVKGLGNTVAGKGTIGGLVADNQGTIQNSEDSSSIIGGSETATVGGLAGTNTGKIIDSMSDSAITGAGSAMGGIVGKNDKDGIVYDVSSHGVSGKVGSTNIGGIVGQNSSAGGKLTINGIDTAVKGITDAYNDSVIVGTTTLGGVAGTNNEKTASLEYVANGSTIDGQDDGNTQSKDIGGLIGNNSGTVDGGRNTGTITGNTNVGGLVGLNDKTSILKNLENGPSATITGETNVGGIAGQNTGNITADVQNTLVNQGVVTGQTYVGGVAGLNQGQIENTNSDVTLQVKDTNKQAQYFGGVAGKNASTGVILNATNTQNIEADKADYVGGIAGWNDGSLKGASNSGNVTGESFVGGVSGLNTRDIKGYPDNKEDTTQEDILIQNSGNVTATKGGAGGIFGENQGTIGDKKGNKHIILSNTGNVTGNNENIDSQGTGGVIGVNKGNISHTSLRNEVKWDATTNSYTAGTVNGTNNVGGVIGLNYGTVTGGRNENKENKTDFQNNKVNAEASSYYEYQILNNGTVTGTGTNAGGLIGKNDQNGSLTAGYNTGSVNGAASVGGVVGSNEADAAVDQVFNTLAGQNTITGTNGVGSLVGTNKGKLQNAYSTSLPTGATDVGSVVGNTAAGSTVTNVYSTSTTGKLFGKKELGSNVTNAYSFHTDDSATDVIGTDDQKKQGSYGGFDFDKDGTDGNANIWKLYEGKSNPLLKVFLNKVNVKDVGADGKIHLTYKGAAYTLADLQAKLTAANGKNFSEHNNTHTDTDPDSGLLFTNDTDLIDADTYNTLFYSQQIATNGKDGSPNNLGYDIDLGLVIDKAVLTVTGNTVNRTYGNTKADKDYVANNGVTGWVGREQGKDHTKDWTFTLDNGGDGGLKNDTQTSNAGNNYTWKGIVTLNGDIAKNYDIQFGNNKQTDGNVAISGQSIVNKANLIITAGDVERTYGNAAITNGNYNIAFDKTQGWVNGDAGTKGTDYDYTREDQNDGGLDHNANDKKVTNNVGDYKWTGSVTLKGDAANNYNIQFKDASGTTTGKNGTVEVGGKSSVNKAQLTIVADDTTIMKGETPHYTGTSIQGLTNGDDKNFTVSYYYGIADSAKENIVGVYSGIIGLVHDGNKFIGLGNTKDNIDALAKYLGINADNYIFDLRPGTLTVKDIYKPTTPDSHWDWLYKDYPWDKIKNFRERRAELHYVDGGVFIEQ